MKQIDAEQINDAHVTPADLFLDAMIYRRKAERRTLDNFRLKTRVTVESIVERLRQCEALSSGE
jgi:hypothetical protein